MCPILLSQKPLSSLSLIFRKDSRRFIRSISGLAGLRVLFVYMFVDENMAVVLGLLMFYWLRNTTVSKSAVLINTQTSSNNNVMQYQLIVYVSSHVMKTWTLSATFLDHSLQTLEMKCTEIPVDQQFLKSLKSPFFPILKFGLNFSR